MTVDIDDVLDYIDKSDEPRLRVIIESVVARQKALRQSRARKMRSKAEKGTRVKFGGSNKPKYLNHQTGTIDSIAINKATVKLDCGPIGKFRSGKVVAPLSALELLEEDAG